jgi:hypothetical protein
MFLSYFINGNWIHSQSLTLAHIITHQYGIRDYVCLLLNCTECIIAVIMASASVIPFELWQLMRWNTIWPYTFLTLQGKILCPFRERVISQILPLHFEIYGYNSLSIARSNFFFFRNCLLTPSFATGNRNVSIISPWKRINKLCHT